MTAYFARKVKELRHEFIALRLGEYNAAVKGVKNGLWIDHCNTISFVNFRPVAERFVAF
jgi:hypothetical protein